MARRPQPVEAAQPVLRARVVAAFGRHFLADDGGAEPRACIVRGRRSDVACGDWVMLQPGDPATIERVLPRRNALWREDAWRSKVFAANLDLLLVVTAAEPAPNLELVGRALVAASAQDLQALVVLNKCELPATQALLRRLQPLRDCGYPLLEVSAAAQPRQAVEQLLPWLQERSSLLIGASGVGKSTLANALIPGLHARTGDISRALDSGRHTTTSTRLWPIPGLPDGSALLDSPGFQAFGLNHLSVSQLQHALPELALRNGSCRFHNCTHREEPGCAVRDAVARGEIDGERYALYLRILQELLQAQRHPKA